jgi:DNA replication protein DnaC
MASVMQIRMQEAVANELTYQQFLENLIEDELELRKEKLLNRRMKAAKFPFLKTLDNFDFAFNTTINKKELLSLASSNFIVNSENVLFIGPPGVGKSHLAISLGIKAIENGYSVRYVSAFELAEDLQEASMLGNRKDILKRYLKPDLLILDEFGMKSLPDSAAEDLLELFHKRYSTKSIIIATNRPVEDWGLILKDNASATAILDRFLEKIHHIKISGRSYRLKNLISNKKEVDEIITY